MLSWPSLLMSLTLLVLAAADAGQDARPVIATREGLVKGAVGRSASGRVFYSFKGVPYARPPLGQLRFQPPQPQPRWAGIKDALDHASRCLQFDFLNNNTKTGSEDCLFVNVYTPLLPALRDDDVGLPVMVWIHGGGFIMGSGDDDLYGPNYFMDENVVLVTFNYRLGPFGFYTTHDSTSPGNYGLLDQIMLLHWVQNNIGAFGGNSHLVTIFGESAGGASVSLLVLSPLARGLFHHAISQSGASLAPFAASGTRKGSAAKFARHLNCSSDAVSEMTECLRLVSADALIGATQIIDPPSIHFLPRVDKEVKYPFLPDDPRSMLERGDFNLVPWMNGLTEEEGGLFMIGILSNETLLDALIGGNHTQWGILAGITVPAESPVVDCDADAVEEVKRVYNFYTRDAPASKENMMPLVRLISDRNFVTAISEEIRLAAEHTPVYKYILDHKGAGRLRCADTWGFPLPDLGVNHGDDVVYLFSIHGQPIASLDSPSRTMIRFMVNLWTSFARSGHPGSSDVLPMPNWPIYTARRQRHMRINSTPSVNERAFEEQVHFWQTVRINEPWRHTVRTEPCPAVKEEL